MFLGMNHLPAVGLGFLGLAGAAVSGFPVYPRSCAGGWREVGAGGRSALAEASPVPKLLRGAKACAQNPNQQKAFLCRRQQ